MIRLAVIVDRERKVMKMIDAEGGQARRRTWEFKRRER